MVNKVTETLMINSIIQLTMCNDGRWWEAFCGKNISSANILLSK